MNNISELFTDKVIEFSGFEIQLSDDISLDDCTSLIGVCVTTAIKEYVEKKTKEDPEYDFHTDMTLATYISAIGRLTNNIEGNWTLTTKFGKNKQEVGTF